MASHHDGAFQELKKMFQDEANDRTQFNYDQFLQYVQAQQLIRIADSLEEISMTLKETSEKNQ
jgi:hypothetical protein